jgi:hypothetical protein
LPAGLDTAPPDAAVGIGRFVAQVPALNRFRAVQPSPAREKAALLRHGRMPLRGAGTSRRFGGELGNLVGVTSPQRRMPRDLSLM